MEDSEKINRILEKMVDFRLIIILCWSLYQKKLSVFVFSRKLAF
jgi:hypothetical protein